MESSEKFESYANDCLQELMPLQEEFMRIYDIDSYEEWYYDHGVGAFHFKSHDGRNLYFKYIDVGSFSTKANTWNWSWDNNSTPRHVKKGLEKVQAFGEANHFNELTQGLFEGDEYTGWAMNAVAAKLLSAIGMYRIPQEHLFIYFIFTNELTQDEYNILKEKSIACKIHDAGRIAFVCQHLVNSANIGFNEAFETDGIMEPDDEHQAWCDECEKIRLINGEWTDAAMAFAQVKAVCDRCYFEIKSRNIPK
ncbi:MAG: hypothetical protein V4592_20840 [Bacteroidota bacterium]